MGVNDSEVAWLPSSGTVEVKTGGREQVASSGPKRVKVTVPVGDVPPVIVATSLISSPSAELGTARVEREGVDAAWLTPPDAAARQMTATAMKRKRRAGF